MKRNLIVDEETGDYLPYTWSICDTCRGEGKRVNPAIDGHGLSREDFDEDPDFAEGYFSGLYDIPCDQCEGGKLRVPDVTRMNFRQKRQLVRQRQAERDYKRDYDSERYLRWAENGCREW